MMFRTESLPGRRRGAHRNARAVSEAIGRIDQPCCEKQREAIGQGDNCANRTGKEPLPRDRNDWRIQTDGTEPREWR